MYFYEFALIKNYPINLIGRAQDVGCRVTAAHGNGEEAARSSPGR